MQCEYCGRTLNPKDWQCPGCGAPVEQKKEESKNEEPRQEKQAKRAYTNDAGQGPNYNKYYEQYAHVDRGQPLHISAYGSFGARLIADWIDLLIVSILCGVFPAGAAMWVLVYGIYRIIGESSICNGATIGKKVMGLKVVDGNFETISVSQSVGRTFSKMLSWALMCFGFIMILFSRRRQGLHDRLSGTYVIKARK